MAASYEPTAGAGRALAQAGEALPRASRASPALRMEGIGKRFPGMVALDGVDFAVGAGEIHGLIGQNGAGKSTLMKILAGDYVASSGTIRIEGRPATIGNPRDALRLGIGIVYQELSLLPNLSVADNMLLGHEPLRGIAIDERRLRRVARGALAKMGISHIDPDAKVGALPVAEQQLVEIAKVLSLDARILIFDEPTASLNHDDSERLFDAIRALGRQGTAIVFVSHRYREVLSLCARCTVLRNGNVVAAVETSQVTVDDLVELTVGRKIEAAIEREFSAHDSGAEPVLEARGLTIRDKVHDADLALHRGEVLGLCGLLGSGQNELARALAGNLSYDGGAIVLSGREVAIRNPRQAIARGVGFVSDSRKDEGIFPDMPVRSNISAAALGALRWTRLLPVLRRSAERRRVGAAADTTGVDPDVLGKSIRLLSGGNQQKAIVARWLMRNSDLLICLEPTRGVDVAARLEIYRRLDALARAGKSVLVVSTDVQEVLTLCDRIAVMCEGRLTATLSRDAATEQAVQHAMQGSGGGSSRACDGATH